MNHFGKKQAQIFLINAIIKMLRILENELPKFDGKNFDKDILHHLGETLFDKDINNEIVQYAAFSCYDNNLMYITTISHFSTLLKDYEKKAISVNLNKEKNGKIDYNFILEQINKHRESLQKIKDNLLL